MIPLHFLRNKTCAVLGLGRSGLASWRALQASDISTLAWDDLPAARSNALEKGVHPVEPDNWVWSRISLLILSPGIPRCYPSKHPVVARAERAGCEIVSDITLLYRADPDAVYVGITGTNGKSTTTSLIAHVLQHSGHDAQAGGNIGQPVLAIPQGGRIYILEISSYQLESMSDVRFKVAVCLNVSADHIDRYPDMTTYAHTKERIFSRQTKKDLAVIGLDDPAGRHMFARLRRHGRSVVGISSRRAVSDGIYVRAGHLIDERHEENAVLDLRSMTSLPGLQRTQNAAAAWAVCRFLRLSHKEIRLGFQTFAGLPHRLERLAVHRNIQYINDSKATNSDSTAHALSCFSDIYWIAGGRSKRTDYTSLIPHLDRISRAYFIGEAASELYAFMSRHRPLARARMCTDLEGATLQASADAGKDNAPNAPMRTVLLSPACSSFDQFPDFAARGAFFRSMVLGLCGHERSADTKERTFDA